MLKHKNEEGVTWLMAVCPPGEMRFLLSTHNLDTGEDSYYTGKSCNEYTDILYKSNHLVVGFVLMAKLDEKQSQVMDTDWMFLENYSVSAWRNFEEDWQCLEKTLNKITKMAG